MKLEEVSPTSNRIVVRAAEGEKMVGRIHMPNGIPGEPVKGVIVARGPGWKGTDGALWPMQTEVGDVVIHSKYGPTEVRLDDGSTVLIMRETDAMAVLR